MRAVGRRCALNGGRRAAHDGSRYTAIMQLRLARLCLDCEEVHDEYRCPMCASDQFTYLSRWVPVPERRERPRQAPTPPAPEVVEAYRQLVRGEPTSRGGRFYTRALVGLGAAGLAGLFFGARRARDSSAGNGRENDNDSARP